MVSREELQERAEIDRQAKEWADRDGQRPKIEPHIIGIITAVGVFCLLDIFAAVTLPDRNTAFWPVIVMTILCAGGAAAIQWRRETAWLDRHNKAVRDIEVLRQ